METGNMNCSPKFNWETTDLVEEWRTFIQHAEFWFAGPMSTKSEEEKCNYLMIWIGGKGRDIYSTWTLTEEEKKSFDHLKRQFEKHVKPRTNRVYSRYRFLSRAQKETETFEKILTDLKLLAKNCGYPEEDDMIRDAIVFGTKDHKVRAKCSNEGSDLTLEKAVNYSRTFELSKEQVKCIEEKTVHAITKKNTPKQARAPHKPHQQQQTKNSHVRGDGRSNTYDCRNCGRHHGYKQCPAFGKNCDACGKMNHFANKCLSKGPNQHSNQKQRKHKHVHTVDVSDDDDDLFLGAIYTDNLEINGLYKENKWTESVNVCKTPISFQLDTGAKCNVIPSRVLQQIDKDIAINPTQMSLRSFSNHTIKSKGSVVLPCTYKDRTVDVLFYVVDIDAQPVLGSKDCEHLNLVKCIYSIKQETQSVPKGISPEYSDVFHGLGCFPGTYTIKVDPSIPPVVHAPRRIPFAIKEKGKAELDRMENIGVIIRQTDPTKWVNSMVTVTKPNGKIRVCIDPRDLNKAIQREHFTLKTVEEVAAMMPGAKIFSKLDATSGFWQMRLDNESSKLCTFNTPFGRYRFMRLPFGVNSAPEVFQRAISEMVHDIDGTEAIIDDILIWGVTQEEHDQRLAAVLERAREYGLKLSLEKR
ncbi:uncharacterized protein K02A2.6-like [Mizuhopecten yessoensis]|uniref:uncharacterized protein K02A2.6-like n=1 Tax=Mizuhopecten yessoensis TaxID=6573 RepID=UPI000B45ACBB|nr:uncharacterized protein K02A2.6-like [Mizuhopecten yessoensis]